MKRILILKSQPKQGGGLEKTAVRIADGFRKRGADVTVLSGEKTIAQWLKDHHADVVLGLDRYRYQTHLRAGNGCHRAFLKSRILSEGRLKYITCHLNPMHRAILAIEKQAFEHPDLKKLFVNSKMVEQEILQHYRVDPKKIVVSHNGVEWHEMQSDFDAWPEIKPKGPFTFLFIGNGYLRKGLGQLLDALAEIKDARLIVIGKDKNLAYYRKKTAHLGLSDRVQFLGPQNNVRSFYQIADALVIPSFYDPFANVTVEALAMGLRVVSSKSNGGSEILKPSTGHIIQDLLSPVSVYATLIEAMKHPKTVESALHCRESVKHLDYANYLNTLIENCYE